MLQLYWRGNSPDLETQQEVLTHLRELGFALGVIFDANAKGPLHGLNLQDRYLQDRTMTRHRAPFVHLTSLADERHDGFDGSAAHASIAQMWALGVLVVDQPGVEIGWSASTVS